MLDELALIDKLQQHRAFDLILVSRALKAAQPGYRSCAGAGEAVAFAAQLTW